MKKPLLINGVWVGKLNDVGFVVYDPSIQNLYDYGYKRNTSNFSEIIKGVFDAYKNSTELELTKISLWVYEKEMRQFFNVASVKEDLLANIEVVSDFHRKKISNSYHHWVYKSFGCQTKAEYEAARMNFDERLKEIAEDDDDWLNRLKEINAREV